MKTLIRACILFWLLLAAQGAPGTENDEHSARIGDLQITATAFGPSPPPSARPILATPRDGHHFVVSEVTIKNVAANLNCTEVNPMLEIGPGGKRIGLFLDAGQPLLETGDLLPAQEREGSYLFEIENGSKPAALVLVRNRNTEELCASLQNRPVLSPGTAEVGIDLAGLPNPGD